MSKQKLMQLLKHENKIATQNIDIICIYSIEVLWATGTQLLKRYKTEITKEFTSNFSPFVVSAAHIPVFP